MVTETSKHFNDIDTLIKCSQRLTYGVQQVKISAAFYEKPDCLKVTICRSEREGDVTILIITIGGREG